MVGKRYSRQRELILRCVQERFDHPTAEMVYKQLRPEHPTLSMGTVYRNLNLLADEGILTRMPFSVERYDANVMAHSHFRCDCCTAVTDIDVPYDSSIDKAAEEISGYRIRRHAVIFRGICPRCIEQSEAANSEVRQ